MDDTARHDVPLWPDGPAPAGAGPDQGPAPALAPYPAAGGGRRAAVVVCPGGGYAGLAPHEGAPVARWLNSLGLHAFVLRYRVAPHRHPAPLLDAQRALRTVRDRADAWGVDAGRVGMLGFSAGGHLCATAGTHFDGGRADASDPVERSGSRPDFLILCYPVISLLDFGHRGSMVNLLGEDPRADLRRSLSNDLQVTPETPPCFLWHTADDRGVPVENSLAFAAALSRHGVPFDLHVYTHGAHGLGLAGGDPHVGTWTAVCAEWLRARGLTETAPDAV